MFSDSDEGEILNPIPMNITDLARMAVKRQQHGKPQINHTPAQAGMKDPNAAAKEAFGIKSETPVEQTDAQTTQTSNEEQTVVIPTQTMIPQNITQNVSIEALTARTPAEAPQVSFFKDAAGNEFKFINGKLFIKGWHEPTEKFRIINEKTGKELSIEGKKVQLFGWSEVSRSEEDNSNAK